MGSLFRPEPRLVPSRVPKTDGENKAEFLGDLFLRLPSGSGSFDE